MKKDIEVGQSVCDRARRHADGVIAKYRAWLLRNERLMAALPELRDRPAVLPARLREVLYLTMDYFLTVTAINGNCLRYRERHESLECALATVSGTYLTDFADPDRWSGYFTLRNGAIARLLIRRLIVGSCLRPHVQSIEIISARYLLEVETYEPEHD